MPKERNRAPFAGFGADMKQARQALGYTQKAFAEAIGIDPRYLANIENSGALPSLPIFYEIVSLCKLPVDRYFYPEVEEAQISPVRERTALKLAVCPENYLTIVEGAIDAAIKQGLSHMQTKNDIKKPDWFNSNRACTHCSVVR